MPWNLHYCSLCTFKGNAQLPTVAKNIFSISNTCAKATETLPESLILFSGLSWAFPCNGAKHHGGEIITMNVKSDSEGDSRGKRGNKLEPVKVRVECGKPKSLDLLLSESSHSASCWICCLICFSFLVCYFAGTHSGRHAKECTESSYDNLLVVYVRAWGI